MTAAQVNKALLTNKFATNYRRGHAQIVARAGIYPTANQISKFYPNAPLSLLKVIADRKILNMSKIAPL